MSRRAVPIQAAVLLSAVGAAELRSLAASGLAAQRRDGVLQPGRQAAYDELVEAVSAVTGSHADVSRGPAVIAGGSDQPQWVGSREAASRLGLTDSRVRQLIREQRLKADLAGRAYRIAVAELDRYRKALG